MSLRHTFYSREANAIVRGAPSIHLRYSTTRPKRKVLSDRAKAQRAALKGSVAAANFMASLVCEQNKSVQRDNARHIRVSR